MMDAPTNDAELSATLVAWLSARPDVVNVGDNYYNKAFIAKCINTLTTKRMTAMLDPDATLNALEILAVHTLIKSAGINLPQ